MSTFSSFEMYLKALQLCYAWLKIWPRHGMLLRWQKPLKNTKNDESGSNLGWERGGSVWGGVQSLNLLPQSFQRFLSVHFHEVLLVRLQGVLLVHLQGALLVHPHRVVVDKLDFTDFLFSPLSPQRRSRILLQLVCFAHQNCFDCESLLCVNTSSSPNICLLRLIAKLWWMTRETWWWDNNSK